MRLDLQRLVLGWSPTLEVSAPVLSDSAQDNSDGDVSIEAQKAEEETIELNTVNIDFEQLISNEEIESIKEMHQYFERLSPTEKNEYTGKYKGYNLILIMIIPLAQNK
jgi:lipoteichoic acid synthase